MNGSKKLMQLVKRHWPLVAIFAVWFALFFRINTGRDVVGYRDSAYLYYPYFQWIDRQWERGEIPLWNPHCDLGYPVVGDGTSSVFYPGKLIFWLRFLNYPARYGLYLSMHVLWAAVGTYGLVLRLRGSPVGAGVAAASYAFGGSVLFQVTNVIYLVSASWLPFGLACVVGMRRRRSWRDSVLAALVAAMMILGGEPQLAYLLGLILVATQFGRLVWNRKRYRNWKRWSLGGCVAIRKIAVFGCVAFTLAAIQILPTYVWMRHSLRAEWMNDSAASSMGSIRDSHSHAIYQFSQPPWTVAEFVWPNFSGRPLPVHQRWVSAFPGLDRMWVPSLYVGLLTTVFAFSGTRFFSGSRKRLWLTWLAVLATVAAFGWYGPVWLYNEIAAEFGAELDPVAQPFGPQVGGLYWLMTIVLPGFESFRYPAKLMVIASLAISVLAGLSVSERIGVRFGVGLIGVFVATLGIWICFPAIESWVNGKATADPFFGPFDLEGWKSGASFGIGQAAVAIFLLFGYWFAARQRPNWRSGCQVILLMALIADLMAANSWMLCTVDSSVFEKSTEVAEKIRACGVPSGAGRFEAGWRMRDGRWRKQNSSWRLAEIVTHQRECLHPKHHLSLPDDAKIQMVGSFTSITHRANSHFRQPALDSKNDNQPAMNGWIRRGYIGVQAPTKNDVRYSLVRGGQDLSGLMVRDRPQVVADAKFQIVEQSANRTVFAVEAKRDVVLLCSMLPYRGWCADVTNPTAGEFVHRELRPAGDFHLAVDVPAGEHRVEIYYRPTEFWVGAMTSAIGWLSLLIGWIVFFRFARV